MTDTELTRDEAIALADDLSLQLYRAEDRVAFVREMLTSWSGPVEPKQVLGWLDHQHCPRAESERQQIARLTAALDLATEFRITCPKPNPFGHADRASAMSPDPLIVRRRQDGRRDGWLIQNPNLINGDQVWTGSEWVYRGELHRDVIYKWDRDEAITEAQHLATAETARYEQWLAEQRAAHNTGGAA